MNKLTSLLALALLVGCSGGSSTPKAAPPSNPSGAWVLSWNDEFSGANGSAPDPTKWVLEQGGGGWGNGELETYTNRLQNAQIQDGNLVITAIKETYAGPDGISRDYTSARLNTKGLFAQSSGKFEARIKIPYGQGIWPAFWLLGNDISTNGWPTCGEIDIMENVGKYANTVYGTIHGPGYSGGSGIGSSSTLPTGKFADDFHLYGVEWEGTQIRFYLDGILQYTRSSSDIPAGTVWVFDHPFFIILNVAVGGAWPGSPDGSTVFPQKMLVDYVRVYRRS